MQFYFYPYQTITIFTSKPCSSFVYFSLGNTKKKKGVMTQVFNPAIKTAAISNTQKSIVEYAEQEARVLYRMQSVFPLDPFPTTLTIAPDTLSIVNNLFGLSQRVLTVNIDEIFTVEVEAGLFFADLKIQQKQATLPVVDLPFFWKAPAMKARRIIQGLLVVHAKQLEIHNMKPKELILYLEEIGSTHT
jgi:hypothetical protein